MHKYKLVVSFVALLAIGCGDKKDDKGDDTSTTTSSTTTKSKGASKGDPAVWKDIKLPKLGLIANAPGDSTVSKMGGLTGMKYKCQAMINEKGNMTPPYDNVLKNVQGGNHGGFEAMVQNDKTDEDNFKIEWTTKSGKFGYSARRTIGEKVYSCNRVSKDKAGHECVMKVCDSLKPL